MTTHHGTVLSDENLTAVRACGCGVIHLTIGALTMNLTTGAFSSLARALARAARDLVQPDFADAEPLLRLVSGTTEEGSPS